MKKRFDDALIPEDIRITELDDGQLEGVWAGANNGCNNTTDCRGSSNTNCTNSGLCVVACGPEIKV